MIRAMDDKGDIQEQIRQNGSRRETPEERADRNMNELLQELRVVQAGVQILVAFLLSMSFTERFARIDDFQRWTYVVTLLLSMLTAGLLIAPAAVHRATFRRGLKPQTVQTGHELFAAGLATLVLTLTGGTLLVLDVAVGRGFAVACAVVVGLVLAGLWFVLPLPLLRHQIHEEHEDTPGDRDDGPIGADSDEPPPEGRAGAGP
jgi:multisubunit Na+/H+ antiporter MnhE subunit